MMADVNSLVINTSHGSLQTPQSPIMKHFASRLHACVQEKQTPALVGLDPRFDRLPPSIIASARERETNEARVVASAFEEFCYRLIDVVAPLVPAVKPQAAFFEEWGPPGTQALARVIRRAREAGLIVICDAKRGDIGSTAEAYARGYLAGEDPNCAAWAADALTVNPYLGRDTLQPFIDIATERGAGIYVLVRTSNPGAGTFQDHGADGAPVFQRVAKAVEEMAASTREDAEYGLVGAVIGATYPRELTDLRQVMPHVPLLVPGYGSQGGGAADVAGAFDSAGLGALVNNSRGINFAFSKEPYASEFGADRWEEASAAATRAMIADLAANTPAGAL